MGESRFDFESEPITLCSVPGIECISLDGTRIFVAAKDDYLVDTLIDMGLLMPSDVESVAEEADNTGQGKLDLLISKGVIRSADVATAKAAQFGVEFVPLDEMKLTDDVIAA